MPREIGIPVQPILVHLVCDCGGQFAFTGGTRPGLDPKGPPQTLHRCPKCNTVEVVSGQPYPRTLMRVIQPQGTEHDPTAAKGPKLVS